MYSILSETLGVFSVASNILVLIAIVAIAATLAGWRHAKGLLLTAIMLFVVAAVSPLGNLLLTPLEQRFPGNQFPSEPIEGILVLGGSYDSQVRGYLSTIVLEEDTSALNVIASLARRYPQAKIVFSGGDRRLDGGPGEAAIAKQLFMSFGIEEKRIEVENQSRTTSENATFSYRLLKPKPSEKWLLVTSAYHVPRAVGAFRTAGFSVIAFPVGWRTHGWRDQWWPSRSAADNLRRIDIAVHEWIGLTVYRLLGYSNAWLPSPNSDF